MGAKGIILAKSLIPNLLRACAIVHGSTWLTKLGRCDSYTMEWLNNRTAKNSSSIARIHLAPSTWLHLAAHGSTWLHLAPLGSYMFLLILYWLLLTLYWLSTGLLQICHVSEQLKTAGNIQSFMMYGLDWITDHHFSYNKALLEPWKYLCYNVSRSL